MRYPTRRALTAAMMGTPLAIGSGLSRAVSAQQPSLPATISLVVGASPAGTTDTPARDVSAVLREKLGPNVVVENRAGPRGDVAVRHGAGSAPDGGTLLVAF